MSRETFRRYLILVCILAVLTSLAVVGMVQIFKAADDARKSVKVTQCQEVVLGSFVHQFHINIAKIEAAEHNSPQERALLAIAIKEPDIAAAMKACEK